MHLPIEDSREGDLDAPAYLELKLGCEEPVTIGPPHAMQIPPLERRLLLHMARADLLTPYVPRVSLSRLIILVPEIGKETVRVVPLRHREIFLHLHHSTLGLLHTSVLKPELKAGCEGSTPLGSDCPDHFSPRCVLGRRMHSELCKETPLSPKP